MSFNEYLINFNYILAKIKNLVAIFHFWVVALIHFLMHILLTRSLRSHRGHKDLVVQKPANVLEKMRILSSVEEKSINEGQCRQKKNMKKLRDRLVQPQTKVEKLRNL